MTMVLAATTLPTTTKPADADVLASADFIAACKQPVAIATAVCMLAMFPVNAIGMFTLFTKMDKVFNPNRIKAEQRHEAFLNRIRN